MIHHLVWALALLAVWPLRLAAHGAGQERLNAAEAVVLQFRYSVGEPMADTDVVVETPEGERWQQARTDADGRFAWVPAREGRWRVIADDGLGHEVRAEIELGPDAVLPASTVRSLGIPTRLLYALLLASLVGNGLLLLRPRASTG